MAPAARQLAQRGDLHRQVVLLDHRVGPHEFDQLALAHHASRAFGQRHQQVEGAAADARGLAADQQHSLQRPDLQAREAMNDRLSGQGHGCEFWCDQQPRHCNQLQPWRESLNADHVQVIRGPLPSPTGLSACMPRS